MNDKTNNNFSDRKRSIYSILLFAFLFLMSMSMMAESTEKQNIGDFKKLIHTEKVKSLEEVVIFQDIYTLRYKMNGKYYMVKFPEGDYFAYHDEILDTLAKNDINAELSKSMMSSFSKFASVLFNVVFAVFIFYFIRSMGFMQKSQATAASKETTKFDDLAGYKYLKKEVKEVVNFLLKPEEYARLNAKIPRGILLYGPPGTGKTLIAKAVAGESHTPFFYVSASSIEDKYIGSGSRNIEKIFDTVMKAADKEGKAILFIDEIDAIGVSRSHRTVVETNQTLNRLLTFMDGFEKNSNIVVFAATNMVETLDEALTRAGRFDRKIHVDLPTQKEREEILNLYINKRKETIHDEVFEQDYASILAQQTERMNNADLENLINIASLIAFDKKKEKVDIECLRSAFIKVVAGIEREHDISEEEMKVIAYHEAGHAVMQILTHEMGHKGIAYITITPHGQSLGHVCPLNGNRTFKNLKTKQQLEDEVKVILAGRAVEEKLLQGQFTTGASSDLQQASQTLLYYVTKYGMSENLQNVFMSKIDENNQMVQDEVKLIRDRIYKETMKMIEKHYDMVERIAEYLLHESQHIDQFELGMILKSTSYENPLTK